MRKSIAGFALCLCSLSLHAQKTHYGLYLSYAKQGVDYPIKIHVTALRYREYGGDANVYVDAVMNGKKVELWFQDVVPFRVLLGDIQARFIKDPEKTGDALLFQEYEAVFSGRRVTKFTVSGISNNDKN
jgi:hypothetical protein